MWQGRRQQLCSVIFVAFDDGALETSGNMLNIDLMVEKTAVQTILFHIR